jgi:hypothetical protein
MQSQVNKVQWRDKGLMSMDSDKEQYHKDKRKHEKQIKLDKHIGCILISYLQQAMPVSHAFFVKCRAFTKNIFPFRYIKKP